MDNKVTAPLSPEENKNTKKDNIKIGWAEEDITPPKKIRLCGQFYERISEYVETGLSVTAMAIECSGNQAVFCSCDLEEISNQLMEDVRDRLIRAGAAELSLDVSKIMLNAIHSHTSYVYTSQDAGSSNLHFLRDLVGNGDSDYKSLVNEDDDEVMSPSDSAEFLGEKISEAILKAWKNRKPAYYAASFGRVPIAHNRRVVYNDGSALMWGNTETMDFAEMESGSESGVELLFAFDEKKQLVGIVANLPCPAQVLEHQSFVSSDYCGKTKELLRKKYGNDIFFLPLITAAGDLCPRDLIRWVQPEKPINDPNIIRNDPTPRRADPSMFDIVGCNKVAKRVFNEISDVFDELDPAEVKNETEFFHVSESVPLTLRRVSEEEYQAAMKILTDFKNTSSDFDYRNNAALHVYAGTVIRYEYQKTNSIFNTEMHFVRLGDLAFVSFPFELFHDYGNRIRANSPAQQTFLIELSCGSGGYLPTARAERGGHYSAYVSSGNVGHIGGAELVEKSVDTLKSFWKN